MELGLVSTAYVLKAGNSFKFYPSSFKVLSRPVLMEKYYMPSIDEHYTR